MSAADSNSVKTRNWRVPEREILRGISNLFRNRLWGTMAGRVWLLSLAGIALSVALTIWLVRRDTSEAWRTAYQSAQVERLATFAQALANSTPESQASVLALGTRMGFVNVPNVAAITTEPEITSLSKQLGETLEQEAKVFRGDDEFCESLFVQTNIPALPKRFGHECYVAQWQTSPSKKTEATNSNESSSKLTTSDRLTFLMLPPRPMYKGQRPNKLFSLGPQLPAIDGGWGLLVLGLCLFALAWVITKVALQPLRILTKAAQDFGRNVEHGDVQEHGPLEIRKSIRTFNQMQQRIRENLAQRTQMMAAITHDLQTPLTRMRLRLEKVQDKDVREKLLEDWEDAQSRIHEGLDLARSLNEQEAVQAVDIISLVETVCWDAADAGQAVQYLPAKDTPAHLAMRVRPLALKRCVENLVSNAIRYGDVSEAKPVTVQIVNGLETVDIKVRDHGPGIPESELKSVFEPFKRLETSRSRVSGGSGLGLAIVRNLMARQGGTAQLQNHPEGGLIATLSFPTSVLITKV